MSGQSIDRFDWETTKEIERVCTEFEDACRAKVAPVIEDYLPAGDSAHYLRLLASLLGIELDYRRLKGDEPEAAEYRTRFEAHGNLINQVFSSAKHTSDELAERSLHNNDASTALSEVALPWIRCPECRSAVDMSLEHDSAGLACPTCHTTFTLIGDDPSVTKLDRGQRIQHFQLLEFLGTGQFGVVWKARDGQSNRVVALKLIPVQGVGTARAQLTLRGVRAASQITDSRVVRIFEVGRCGGLLYVSQELIEGFDLAHWLQTTRPTHHDTAKLCAEIADILHVAHEAGVVHRDLKPANVLIDATGKPHLTDFGLAKKDASDISVSLDGQLLGTPAYMAPEQARGAAETADRRADIYSMGVILFQCLTDELPFRGKFHQLINQIVYDEAPRLRTFDRRVPRDLETICLKCLEKSPNARYQTAREVSDDVRRFLDGRPITARSPSVATRLRKWTKRRPRRAAFALSLAAFLVLGFALIPVIQNYNRSSREQLRAESLVDAVISTELEKLPQLVSAELPRVRRRAIPILEDKLTSPRTTEDELLRVRLALVGEDTRHLAAIVSSLETMEPTDILTIREYLRPYRDKVSMDLWTGLDTVPSVGAFPRYAAVLAEFTPNDPKWTEVAPRLARTILSDQPIRLTDWLHAFEPIGHYLVEPLTTILLDPRVPEPKRLAASTLVAHYAADKPRRVADLLLQIEPREFPVLLAALHQHRDVAIGVFDAELQKPPTRPEQTDDGNTQAKRQARAAAALVLFGRCEPTWSIFNLSGPDIRLRAYLVHLLPLVVDDPTFLATRLAEEISSTERMSILLTLGQYKPERVPAEQRATIVSRLIARYRDDPDPGVHSAIDWLLRARWGYSMQVSDLDSALVSESSSGRRWFVNSQRSTFAVFHGPVRTVVGALPKEEFRAAEPRHYVDFDYSFAVATREVTIGDFAQFVREKPNGQYWIRDYVSCPIWELNWFLAAEFCQWLSKQEGIPPEQWCYGRSTEVTPGIELPMDHTKLLGYRMPSPDEWEFVCRAGTETPRFFGWDSSLLDAYSWNLLNSNDTTHSGGMLMPNDFGMFDIFGNVWEWCTPPDAIRDADGSRLRRITCLNDKIVYDNSFEYLPWAKGGSFLYHAPFQRAANRYRLAPGNRDITVGFRLARTMPDKHE